MSIDLDLRPAGPDADLAGALTRLAARLDGDLTRPGDACWDDARAAWNLAVDQQPVAVVRAGSVADVVATVTAARALGLRVAAQGTGHNPATLAGTGLAGTVLLRTSALRGVTVDPLARTARAEAGALWLDVVPAAAAHGLTALAGSAPDVGVVGYTLGGGISWHARSRGLACNEVVAVEIVTADGVLRRIDADHDPELFWAVRGGGGSFGVVTAVEFRLLPFAEVSAGALFFPIDRAREVLTAWRDWTATVPDEVTSLGRLLRFPPLPDLPPFLSGQSFVLVEAVVETAGRLTAGDAEALLAPLRALGPAVDTFTVVPTAELGRLHLDPPGPVPAAGDGMLLADLPGEALDAVLAVCGPDVDSPLLSVEFRHLGGALAPHPRTASGGAGDGGCVTGFDAGFAMFAVGMTPVPPAVQAVRAHLDAVRGHLRPWAAEVDYLNFAEHHRDPATLFGAGVYARLQQVKRAYDPTDLIRSNHPVRLP